MILDENDYQIKRSRAVTPEFYRAPYPGQGSLKPHEYQHAGAEYALARSHALIGDAPGVGKTLQGILISNAIEAEYTLVVCPASLRLNWEREIWRWSTIENVSTYPILKSRDGVSLKSNYVIVSYNLLHNSAILEAIADEMWDHVILDEAHKMKDPKGNRTTEAICNYLPAVAGRFTLLSGTILPNQPVEVYNAARLLDWDCIDRMSLESFRDYYYERGGGMVRGKVWIPDHADKSGRIIPGHFESKVHWSDEVRNKPRNLDELQARLRKHIMIRRLKEDVLHELPAKQWHPFPLETTADIRRALKHPGWQKAEKLYHFADGTFDGSIPIDGEFSTARRLLGEAKAPAVADYIEELLLSGTPKVVVGAWHKSVLSYLRERLSRYGLTYMDGGTSASAKQKAVDRFQHEEKVKVILGQIATLGEGWTLTEAQDAVLVEPDPVPGRNDQFLDRIHRQGQKGSHVTGHVPVVPATIDERMLAIAVDKDANIFAALDRRGG